MKLHKRGIDFEIQTGLAQHDEEICQRIQNNIWEEDTFQCIKDTLKEGSIYIDLGGWIGLTSLFAAKITNRCYAVEPDPIAYEAMKTNIVLNQSPIVLDPIAIMDYDGAVNLGVRHVRGDSMSGVLYENNPENLTVPCLRLESYMSKHGLTHFDLLKMDIEGAEVLVLPDIKNLIISLGRPTIHLSLHTGWAKDRDKFIETALDFISLYDIPKSEIENIKMRELYQLVLKK